MKSIRVVKRSLWNLTPVILIKLKFKIRTYFIVHVHHHRSCKLVWAYTFISIMRSKRKIYNLYCLIKKVNKSWERNVFHFCKDCTLLIVFKLRLSSELHFIIHVSKIPRRLLNYALYTFYKHINMETKTQRSACIYGN